MFSLKLIWFNWLLVNDDVLSSPLIRLEIALLQSVFLIAALKIIQTNSNNLYFCFSAIQLLSSLWLRLLYRLTERLMSAKLSQWSHTLPPQFFFFYFNLIFNQFLLLKKSKWQHKPPIAALSIKNISKAAELASSNTVMPELHDTTRKHSKSYHLLSDWAGLVQTLRLHVKARIICVNSSQQGNEHADSDLRHSQSLSRSFSLHRPSRNLLINSSPGQWWVTVKFGFGRVYFLCKPVTFFWQWEKKSTGCAWNTEIAKEHVIFLHHVRGVWGCFINSS